MDVEFQKISAETVDPTFTGGIYLNGMSDLDIYSFEAGYLVGEKIEIVAGLDSLDADNFSDSSDRTSFGLNCYFNKHKTKFQLTYRMSENVDGVSGNDLDEMYGQFQFVF